MPGDVTPLPRRVGDGLRRSRNWFELVRFLVVGASGFTVNVGTYAIAVHFGDIDYRIASVLGFVAGVLNGFFWHRHWTFKAKDGHAGTQGAKFVTVYLVTLVITLLLLQLLVEAGASKVIAQMGALILVTPMNFLGQKLWSFDV